MTSLREENEFFHIPFLTNDPSLRYSIVPNWHVFKLMGGVGSLPKRAEYDQSLIQANPLKKLPAFPLRPTPGCS